MVKLKPLKIDNLDTMYQITEDGEIYNTKTKKFLSGTIRNGYRMVKLTVNGVKKDYLVHVLVASTYLDNQNNLPQVNHKDRNKLNNSVSNLEWVSCKDNMNHARITSKPAKRQPIHSINEPVDNEHGWRQYKDSNYWFNIDGRGANKKTGKYLNPSKRGDPDGYLSYQLYFNGVRKSILIHRIIYPLFSGYELSKDEFINHIDGNKQNNAFSNLEIVTRSENMQHCYYVLNKKVKPVIQYDLNGVEIAQFPSASEAARILGYTVSGISQACNGATNTYKGYIWKYI